MIVDTSALVAIVRDEQDANRYAFALAVAGTSVMSAATHDEPLLCKGADFVHTDIEPALRDS